MNSSHADDAGSEVARGETGTRARRIAHRFGWTLPLLGLLSLIWFVVRVVPKPSRMAYPCQKVAGPIAGSFLVWIGSVIASAFAFRRTRDLLSQSRLHLAAACMIVAVGFGVIAIVYTPEKPVLADPPAPNNPIGEAKGINPGRVVWVHDPDATNWTLGVGRWWDYTDQGVVDDMMERAIRGLVGTPNLVEAWNKIFKYSNLSQGKGDVGYTPGEKIAIKVNFVGSINSPGWGNTDPNTHDFIPGTRIDYMSTSPQAMLALLKQLINVAGVAQSDIYIGDPVCYWPDAYFDPLHSVFPNVHYMEYNSGQPLEGREYVRFADGLNGRPLAPLYWSSHPSGYTQDYMPVHYAIASYFINMANLKSHDSNGGVTLCGKNHYGTLNRTPVQSGYYNLHYSLPFDEWAGTYAPGYGKYRAIVDLMGHADTGGKMLLCLIDGLYSGHHPYGTAPTKWVLCPPYDQYVGGDWSSCLLVSQDPVAIDSVGFDLVRGEWHDPNANHGGMNNGDGALFSGADDYLVEAAKADNPDSGTFYDPDHAGNVTRMASQGIHEHWSSDFDKRYSRNLGFIDGIELAALTTQEMLNVRPAGVITIDGDPSDWNLAEFGTLSRGGEREMGDIGAVGWIDGTFYAGAISDRVEWGYTYTPPANETDHAVRFYSRHDAAYQYFLVRFDDDIIWTTKGYNFENDCAEFFIDPGRHRSTDEMWGSLTDSGPFELVIDAKNERSVAETSSTYRSRILAGVTSAVSVDATGWWLEVRIAKNATIPALPASGTFGLNINFRDQDAENGNEHLYGWTNDYAVPYPVSSRFPDKVPHNFGNVYNGYQVSEDPPMIAEVLPDPDLLAIEGVPYQKQLLLLEGTPPIVWSRVQGPNGLNVASSGLVSGWTPGAGDVGNLLTVEIQAQNAYGADSESWQVCTQSHCVFADFDSDNDVDLDDFAHLQCCLSGTGVSPNDPDCWDADLSGDGFVDQQDVGVFLGCMQGAKIPVLTTCGQ